VNLDDGAVEGDRLEAHANDVLALQLLEHPVEDTVFDQRFMRV
jgi:hypothetical protein